VERKRLHGVTADARTKSAPGGGIYTPQANRATYDRLAQLADAIVSAGFTAIVDAAFLKRPERDRFRALADRLGVPFHILACEAPVDELRKRIAHRAAQGKDPSEANFQVLDRQLAALDPLEPQEKCLRLPVEG
jgi:hypothetical protein